MDEVKTKHKHIQNAHHIAMDYKPSQSNHSSPYHVHPYPSPVRLQHAFQNSPQGTPKMFHPKGLHKAYIDSKGYCTPNDSPILGRALCLTPKGSPIPGRVSHLNEKFQDCLTLTSDTDSLVAKISAMFPTVSETHIKILLKKYYNREAVVISALQVEKHPITTPGPLSMSPSVSRLQRGAVGVYSALQLAKGVSASTQGSTHHLTSLSVTPHGSPSLLRPDSGASYVTNYPYQKSADTASTKTHHSPKMKLKYLSNIFPKADETIILDVLCNKDNNVQKATEELIKMGFTKKETVMKPAIKKDTPQPPKKVVTIMKTMEEKGELKKKMMKKYPNIPERVITIALDSVGYNEDRAIQILSSVVAEEETPKKNVHNEEKSVTKTCVSQATSVGFDDELDAPKGRASLAPSASPGITTRVKNWTERLKPILKSTTADIENKYKSHYPSAFSGPNPQMRMGPKEGLLLEDYMAWKGPNPENRLGTSVVVEGPDQQNKRPTLARGPNPNLSKGPQKLAKGSMYQKINNNMCVH